MKLEGVIHVVVESKKKRAVENNVGVLLNSQYKDGNAYEQTPLKSSQSSLERDIGSTQLRKTVFMKHYSDRGKISA